MRCERSEGQCFSKPWLASPPLTNIQLAKASHVARVGAGGGGAGGGGSIRSLVKELGQEEYRIRTVTSIGNMSLHIRWINHPVITEEECSD